MGYLHIDNLYKNRTILQFPTLYALEKVHGTSAHITWANRMPMFFSGGAKQEQFVALFDIPALTMKLESVFGGKTAVVYGEAYGGKLQAMAKKGYGPDLKFIVFDVKIDGEWMDVPIACGIAFDLGLEFVPYSIIGNSLAEIDAERDKDSYVAVARGFGLGYIREGVVLRPQGECVDYRGNRVIAKHKRPEFTEHKKHREIDPANKMAYDNAQLAAEDWVTEMRMSHVLDSVLMAEPPTMEATSAVIKAMIADVKRESEGELEWNKDIQKAVGCRAASMYKRIVTAVVTDKEG
jgi:hypothetical protein